MRRSAAALAYLLIVLVASQITAQDADTIVLKDENRKFTLVSQIEDPKEAAAFLRLAQTTEPDLRHGLATNFLKLYPQSWLLPQVLDIAARSAIELSNYDEALDEGGLSLRLLPENPSLLVLLAEIEARKTLFERSIAHASDALEYLDEIERPSNMSQHEWNAVRPQLKSSAYFARARAEAARALASNPHDSGLLSRALADLNSAAAWNSQNEEVFYLRSIVELDLKKRNEAAADLAFVFQSQNPLREKARSLLLLLSKQMAPKGTSLEAFLGSFPARRIDATLQETRQPAEYSQVLAKGYTGPETCKGCHPNEYANWRKTGMARMLRPYRPENILGDFSPGTEYKESDSDVIRMGSDASKKGRPYFQVLSQSSWSRFYVDYTIGSKWQQGYATKLPDGRMQVLPVEYNVLQKRWVNYWKIIDPPGSPRAIIRDFPHLTADTNYQRNCAICHTSQLKLNPAASDPMQHAAYLQPGVDCEMCHGPAAWHVQRFTAGKPDRAQLNEKPATEPPFDFRKATNRDSVRVCAQCHRQSAVREIGENGEMNYSTENGFVPAAWLRPYDAFSRKAFYKDGRFRETTFIVEAFTRSACYRRGTAQCATCHSPHLANFDSNPTSLKYQKDPDEMCLPCHTEYRNRVVDHTHHRPGSEASQCVSCHMPRIANALLFKARSHQIEVPSVDLTERFGQQDSPNVCLECHAEKNTRWAKEQLASWRH